MSKLSGKMYYKIKYGICYVTLSGVKFIGNYEKIIDDGSVLPKCSLEMDINGFSAITNGVLTGELSYYADREDIGYFYFFSISNTQYDVNGMYGTIIYPVVI